MGSTLAQLVVEVELAVHLVVEGVYHGPALRGQTAVVPPRLVALRLLGEDSVELALVVGVLRLQLLQHFVLVVHRDRVQQSLLRLIFSWLHVLHGNRLRLAAGLLLLLLLAEELPVLRVHAFLDVSVRELLEKEGVVDAEAVTALVESGWSRLPALFFQRF